MGESRTSASGIRRSGLAEAHQEIAEGVPECTGVVIREPDIQAARWRAV